MESLTRDWEEGELQKAIDKLLEKHQHDARASFGFLGIMYQNTGAKELYLLGRMMGALLIDNQDKAQHLIVEDGVAERAEYLLRSTGNMELSVGFTIMRALRDAAPEEFKSIITVVANLMAGLIILEVA